MSNASHENFPCEQPADIDIDENYYQDVAVTAAANNNNKTNTTCTKDNAIFSNLREFLSHSMIIIADPYDNFYQNKLHLTLEQTQFILDKILFVEWFPLCSGGVGVLFYFAAQLYWYFLGENMENWLYLLILTVACSICILLTVHIF